MPAGAPSPALPAIHGAMENAWLAASVTPL